MSTSLVELTLESVAGGAAVELFDREFRKVLDNILDPNTDPTAARSVKIEIKIKPTEDRESGTVSVVVGSKLATAKPVAAQIFMGMHNGKPTAVMYDPRQPGLFDEGQEPSVLPLPRERSV